MKILSILFLALTFFFSACDKNEGSSETATGTIYFNAESGTACTYNIRLDGGRVVYPVNYEKIESYLINGSKVTISFQKTSDPSPCENSESVFIEEIR